jgi:hypothetical protein
MTKWILLLISILLLLLMSIFIMMGPSEAIMDGFVKDGLIPRIVSWLCLILGVYGIARRRFSPLMMMFFFAIAFFFTYIGQFMIKELY